MMTSPSTLMGVTMTLLAITKDFQRAQNIEKIEKQLISLKEDSDRMIQRYEKAYRSANTLIKQLDDLHISMDKINGKIQGMYEGEEKDG
jgi:DNA recombination protein RmuC